MAGSRFRDDWRRLKASFEPLAEIETTFKAEQPADPLRRAPDVVLRYATIGIFLILLIGALKASQIFSMPITAGIVLGLIFGPLTDWIAERRVPHALAAALVVAAFVIVVFIAAGLLAVPVAMWAGQIPAMINVLKVKIALLFNLGGMLGDVFKIGPVDAPVDAIVNAANAALAGGGGVDGAIHRAAGPELHSECHRIGGCPPGEARVTHGYNLPAPWVIHTVGPLWRGGDDGEADILATCYVSCLLLAREKGFRQIAFSAIATGVYGFPREQAAQPERIKEKGTYTPSNQ